MAEKLAKGRAARLDYEHEESVRAQRAKHQRDLLDPHNDSPSPELLAAWEPIREEMRSLIDESVWRIWLEPIHLHRVVDGVWWLACPARSRGWIQTRWGRAWGIVCDAQVRFVVCDTGAPRAGTV
jgi:hypothetical protein